ncbi:MAG: hypothetical protein E7635_04400 [Ruminococcaceae bacterium]|nr:hypothetical protein [Oscillospiraceae bacterium]
MRIIKKMKMLVSILTVICMISVNLTPIFAEGTMTPYSLVVNETAIELLREPEQNEMGLMLSAKEILDAVDIKYEHDEDLDSFEIFVNDSSIMLMHNATHYYIDEEPVDCQPYFTVADVPLIEIGFLCELIDYEYEHKIDERVIILTKLNTDTYEIVEENSKTENKDEYENPNISSVEKESNTDLVDEADDTDTTESVEDTETDTSTEEDTTEFTEDTEADISSDTETYSSRGSGADVTYEDSFDLTYTVRSSGNGTLSGTITLPSGAPEGGLNISLILEETRTVYRNLYGTSAYYYDAGSQYTVATVDFSEGEKSKTYFFDAGSYQSSTKYSEYVIFYETSSNEIIDKTGYVKEDGTTQFTSKLSTESELANYLDIKLFDYGEDITANIAISEKDMSCGDNAVWSYDKKTKTLTISGSGDVYDFAPHGAGWSNYDEEIEAIVIENGITSIGENAFYYCISAQKVTIPDSVNDIGRNAFQGCRKLQSVVIPEGVKTIERYTFYDCNNLNLIVIPKSVQTVYNNAFPYRNPSILNLVYEGSETDWNKIGCGDYFNNKYFNCKEFVVENNIEYLIKDDSTAVVVGLTSDTLTSLTIPEKVKDATITEILAGAFANKTNLISVTLPNGLKKIGDRAFYQCTGLIGVNIRDNVSTIGEYAFYGCTNLTNITLPNELSKIEECTFYRCNNLTKINIPDKVISIDGSAFEYCKGIKEVSIPDSVISIGQCAFYCCNMLRTIYLGNGVKEIGSDAFGNYNWTNVYITDLKAWCEIDFENECSNPLYGYDSILYLNGESMSEIIIPDEITEIKDYAFYCCSNLESVVLHENITSIGGYAFRDCARLTKINLPNSLLTIGAYAFSDCSLKSIDIPDNLEMIEEGTFSGCAFNTVTIPASVVAIKAKAFSGCKSLTEVTVTSANTQIVGTAFNTSGLKIYGLIGSSAETYASTQGYVFEAMDDVIYTITFDANGGDTAPAKQNKGFGTPISLTRDTPTKKHCTFLGWSLTLAGEVVYLPGDTFTDDNDTTLYAVWAEPQLTVNNKKAVIGSEVEIYINISNNPGIALAGFDVNYDNSAMTLISATLGDVFIGELECNIENVPYVFNVYDTEDKANNGTLLILKFAIKQECFEGDYPITVSNTEFININEEVVTFNIENGKIDVIDTLPGDVNGDGQVTRSDLLRLAKSFSGFDVEMDMTASDVTGDGAVTRTDLLRLAKYFSGFDVVLGK